MNKTKERLDIFLVSKGFFDSRSKAAQAAKEGHVFVDGKQQTKPSAEIEPNAVIECQKDEFVSRAAKKLQKALKVFGINPNGKTAIDVGASTGGFTQVLLKNGAKHVLAVDTGEGQLHPSIASDPRVENKQKTNFLKLLPQTIKAAQLVVCDVSFVAVEKLKNQFANATCPIIILIKPQFECGKEYAKKHKGVVKDPATHQKAIQNVVAEFASVGLNLLGLDVSPILGGDGNREFLALFQKNVAAVPIDIKKIVEKPTQE